MWPVIGVISITVGIIFFEVPSLVKKGLKKELVIFSILLSIGFVLSILLALDMEIPNPFDILTTIYKPITDLMMSFFE